MAIENIQEIEKLLKLKEGSLTEAITKEEAVKIEIPALHVFNDDELKTRDSRQYGLGKDAEREMSVKNKAKDLNMTIDKYDMDTFLDAYKNLVKKEIGATDTELQKAIEDRDDKIKTLSNTILEEQNNAKEIENRYINKLNQNEINEKNNEIIGKILAKNPAAKLTIDKSDAVVLFNSNFSSKKTESGIEVFKGEKRLEDPKTFNPIALEEVWETFLTEKKLIAIEGGSGQEGGGASGGKKNMDSFLKEMTSKGIKYGSEEFQAELNKRIEKKEIM